MCHAHLESSLCKDDRQQLGKARARQRLNIINTTGRVDSSLLIPLKETEINGPKKGKMKLTRKMKNMTILMFGFVFGLIPIDPFKGN